MLLNSNRSNLESNLEILRKETEMAKSEGKTKKVENLATKEQNLLSRKQMIDSITPISRRLVHGDMIQKCWTRLFPLQALEDKGRSISLTLNDLKTLEEKDVIVDQISQMQNASRGWFEEDSVFELMCEYEEKEAMKKYKAKKDATKSKNVNRKSGIGSSSSSRSASGSNSWNTIGKSTGSRAATSSSAPAKKSGFAAAFADDDSSDED